MDICPVCRHSNPPEAASCDGCGAHLRRDLTRDGADAGLPGSERRTATVLFADLADYTQLNEALDPEDVAALMRDVKLGTEHLVEEHGGTLNQFAGDQVMALFGVPVAHDEDPVRAVQAALAIHALMNELSDRHAGRIGRKLAIHIGVNTGLVLAQRSDLREGAFQVTGDAVNTGARLTGVAGPGEVIVGPATYDAISVFFDTEPLPPMSLRGKRDPLVPHRVLGIVARSRFDAARRRGLSKLVGRAEELERFRGALDQLSRGRSGWIAVSGEPGVGKSRLFHEFEQIAERAGILVLHTRCEAFGATTPYDPFARLLRRRMGFAEGDSDAARIDEAVRRLESLGEETRARIPVLLHLLSLRSAEHRLPAEARGEALQMAIHESIDAWLRAEASREPVVVMLEDWHSADTGSELALRTLLRGLDSTNALLLVNHRSHYQPEWPTQGTRLQLEPLARGEAQDFIDALLPSASPNRWRRLIRERTAGNPLFIEEVCRGLRESGALDEAPPETESDSLANWIPDSVQAVVRARIDRLGEEAGRLLRIASVLGDAFPMPVLRRLAERSDVEASVAELGRAGLLSVGGDGERGRFHHAITREVAYQMLPRKRRRELHEAAGGIIEAQFAGDRLEAHYEELSHHFSHGHDEEKALLYLERAGDKASASFSLAEARRHYGAAVGLLARLEPTQERRLLQLDLTFRWAQAGWYGPTPDQLEALAVARGIASELGERAREVRCIYFSGWLHHTLGASARAVRDFEACIDRADPEDHRLLSQLYCNLGENLGLGARHAEALDHLERGLAMRKRAFPEHWRTIGMAYALAWKGLIHADRGDFEAYEKQMDEAMAIIGPMRHGSALASINQVRAIAMALRGDWEASGRYALVGRAVTNAIGAPGIHGMALCVDGYRRFMQRGSGVHLIERGLREMADYDTHLAVSIYLAFAAEAMARRGDAERGLEYAERAIARAEEGDRIGEVAAHRARALALASGAEWRPGRPEAEASLSAAERLAAGKQSPRDAALTDLVRAELCLHWGERVAAERSAEAAARTLSQLGMSEYEARARTILASSRA